MANLDNYSIKAAGDFTLDVLGIPFGGPNKGKDAHGQYFSQRTKTYLDDGREYPAFYYHGLGDDGRPVGEPVLVGSAKYDHTDERGHWFKVALDRAKGMAVKVWKAANAGNARASSGAVAHLVRLAKDGEILNWVMGELSVFDTDNGKQPANNYAVALPAMKSNYQSAGLVMPDLPETPESETAVSGDESAKAIKSETSEEKMDEKTVDIKALVAEELKNAFAAKAATEQAETEKQAAIKAAVDAEKVKWEAEAAKSRRLPMIGGAPYVTQYNGTGKYDGMSAGELSLAIAVGESTGRVTFPDAAYKALAIKNIEDKSDPGFRDLTPEYSQSAMKAAGIPMDVNALKAATDPLYTGGTTDGGNWVHTSYAREIWAAIRADAGIVGRFPSQTIPDGYKSATIPIEGTDLTWYSVAEASSSDATLSVPAATVTASQITTPTNKEITVGKVGARGLYSGELTEDSIINFVPQLRAQLIASGKEQMDHLAIDGDSTTTANTNINDIGNGSAVTAGTLFLRFDGLRKLALVTNTANSVSASGGLTEDNYIDTMWMMGTAGLAGAEMGKCSFIVDPYTYKKSLKMANLKTKDVWSNATMETGRLTGLWGYEIIPTWQMHYKSASRLANTAGKVDQTVTTNNLYGAILAVRWDQWRAAFKRAMTIETTRIANADAWEIVALMRWGLGYRDTEAAAITYYVGV